MLRTAAAFGVAATFALPGTVDLWNAKVVRSGMGAHFHHLCLSGTWDELDTFRRTHRSRLGRRRRRRAARRARAARRGWRWWSETRAAACRQSRGRAPIGRSRFPIADGSRIVERRRRDRNPSLRASSVTTVQSHRFSRKCTRSSSAPASARFSTCASCAGRSNARSSSRARAVPKCGNQLAWFENVPILSWVALRGHCRCCDEPISPMYPLVELGVALGWLLAGAPLRRHAHRAPPRRVRHRAARRRDDRREALSHSRRLHAVRACRSRSRRR